MKDTKFKNKLPGKHFKKLLAFLSAAAFIGTSMGAGARSVYADDLAETQVTTELETASKESIQTEETVQSVSGEETKAQENFPAFDRSVDIDGVTVSVKAEEGVFPEDSWLSVEKVSKDDQKRINAAVDEVREENLKTAVSYTYDIKVFNKENEEMQPADDAKVRVSFSTEETDNSNLSAQIYHISDDMKAEAPEVKTKGDTAYVVTEGFSFYTVEFTYNELQYVLEGDTAVSLKKVLDTLGLEGTATNVEVSNSKLFSVHKENNVWMVSANKAFKSQEWMKVTIDGVVYEIVVTDYVGGIDNDAVLGTYNIIQGGDVTNFAAGMDIPSIYIDYSKLSGKPDRYLINNRGWTDYTATGQGPNEPFQISTVNGTNTSWDSNAHSRYKDTLRTRANGTDMFDWTTLYRVGKGDYKYSYSVRYNNAASDASGKYDVIIKYDAISLYLQSGAASSNPQTNLAVFNNTNGPAVRATSTTGNYRYGVKTNVTVSVVDGGSDHAGENAVSGTFLYSVAGLDQGRESVFRDDVTVSGYHNIKDAGDYVTAKETNNENSIFGDRTEVNAKSGGNYNFSESVTKPTGLSGNLYIPKKDDYAVFINDNGRFVATPYTSGDDKNHHSFIYGFAALGSASGVTTTAYSSSFMNDTDSENENLDRARDIYILQSGAAHDMTSASGDHGSIWLWDTGTVGSGNVLHNDQVPADAVRTFNVPNGKAVTYKLLPDAGYTIDDITVDGSSYLIGLQSEDTDRDGKPDYWTYTFPATDSASHSIKVTWKEDDETRKITTSSGPNGSLWLWDSGELDNGTVVHDNTVPANDTRTNSFPDDKEVVIKLVADNLFTLDQVTTSSGPGSATPVDLGDDGKIDYWTYTVQAGADPASVHVTWKVARITQCDDCGNQNDCKNCWLATVGAIEGYTNVNDKSTSVAVPNVFRGGSSPSGVSVNSDGSGQKDYKLDNDQVTFADVLPHGNIYIDSSRLSWSNANGDGAGEKYFDIDIKDTTHFKWVGDTTVVDASGDSPSTKLNHSNRANIPIVAYYGYLHSYLRYEGETNNNLGLHDPDNTAAIPANVANGTYEGVRVVNGTNTIEAGVDNNYPYLYKITYYGAAVLQDGSRANLVLTVKKVEFESTMTTENPVYVGIQGANSLYMIGDYKDPDTEKYYFTNGFQNPSGTSTGTIRNAVGDGLSIDLQIQDNNGVAIPGSLTYAAQDLDIASYESFWGRVPAENEGSTSTDGNDYWKGTHELYAYGEGMEVKSGALSYALMPQYENSGTDESYLTKTTSDTGALPINMVIDNMNRYHSAGETTYESPIRVEKGTNGELRFVTSSAHSVRNAGGTFDNVGYNKAFDYTNNYERYGTSVTRPQNDLGWSGFRQEMDSKSSLGYKAGYDAGFAINLDASGSELRFTGSQHVGSGASLETKLFDTSFLTYIQQSHGTGGGIFVEDYDYMHDCDPIYREGLVTLPYNGSIKSIVAAEDGYRFSAFTVTKRGGSPVRYNIKSDGVYDSTSNDMLAGFGEEITDTGLTVTKNSNGTYSIEMDDITDSLDIHADFDADYYFQKVWEGGAYDEDIIPEKLYMTAVPYIAAHDSVEIDGITYQISRSQTAGGPVVTKYTYKDESNVIHSYTLNDNNYPDDLQMISAGQHPTAKYPQIKIGDAPNQVTYVVMGNELYRTKPSTVVAGTIMVDDAYAPIPINVKLVRATLGTKDFVVCKSDVGVKKDSANKAYITKEVKNGDVIWKMYYPSEGAAGLSDENWPMLPIEIEDSVIGTNSTNPDASNVHHVTTDHVERVYWFATEDINKLTEKWLLKNYVNEYSNDEVEVAGIASYKDGDKLAFKDNTYWYTQSTKDHDDVAGYMDKMANIQLEYMSPFSDGIKKNDGSNGVYSGWGGKVTNRIVETKLKVYKQWLNDESRKLLRTDLKMTVKRVYKYSQPDTVPEGKVSFTMPTGQDMNNIMETIAGGASNVEAFKRGVEPLLEKKTAAKTTGYGEGDYVKVSDAAGTGSEMYIWYDSNEKCIYYWTDADAVEGTDSWYIYLNRDASGMFKDFDKLKDIPGLDDINTSRTTKMSSMFELPNSGGELIGLNYLRKWDTSKVTDFSNMFKNQSKLENINGVIDWNVKGAGIDESKYAGIFVGTKGTGGQLELKGKVPFIYYPHLQVDDSGNLDFVADDTSMASDVACNLIYDYDGTPGNNSGTLKNTNTAKWTWDMGDLLTASDVTKWEYRVYEDPMSNYTNLDGAVWDEDEDPKDKNAVLMVRNPKTGYYEYTLTNERLENEITVDKKVTGNMGAKDKYFKFKIEIEGVKGTVLNLDTTGMTTSGFGDDNKTPNSDTNYKNVDIKNANTRDDDTDDTNRTYSGDKSAGKNVFQSSWTDGNDVYEYSLDDGGKWKKGNTVIDTEPPDNATYKGKAGQQVILDDEGKATVYVYLNDNGTDGQKLVIKNVPRGTKYKITEEDAKEYDTVIYDGRSASREVVVEDGKVVEQSAIGDSFKESANGWYYKLNGSADKYERPEEYYVDYNGSNLRNLPKYRFDTAQGVFVQDDVNGTYYKVIDGAVDGTDPDNGDFKDGYAYVTQAPGDRYVITDSDDTTKKYTANIVRSYENHMDVITPTGTDSFPWYWVAVTGALAGGVAIYLIRRIKDKEDKTA